MTKLQELREAIDHSHSACQEQLEKFGDDTPCCACSGHEHIKSIIRDTLKESIEVIRKAREKTHADFPKLFNWYARSKKD